MNALCHYDKGTKGFEGRRYKKDIASAIDAQERFFAPIKATKKKLPEFVMLEGNHEYRIRRAIDLDASHLDGVIAFSDLSYAEFGWKVIPYNGSTPGIVVIDGIAYSHFHTSGNMGRAISSQHSAYQLISQKHMSCTVGHSHLTDYCVRNNAQGKRLHGLVAGCYIDYFADYAGGNNEQWWKGVVFCENVKDGQYDPRWIGLDSIQQAYG